METTFVEWEWLFKWIQNHCNTKLSRNTNDLATFNWAPFFKNLLKFGRMIDPKMKKDKKFKGYD